MDVLRLYVTMNDAILVQIVHCREQLADDISCLNFVEVEIGSYTFIEGASMTHFVDEVDLLLVFIHLDHLADVWVIQLLQKLDLFEKLATLTKL